MSSASKRANGQVSDPVLASRFMAVLNHSVVVDHVAPLPERTKRQNKIYVFQIDDGDPGTSGMAFQTAGPRYGPQLQSQLQLRSGRALTQRLVNFSHRQY